MALRSYLFIFYIDPTIIERDTIVILPYTHDINFFTYANMALAGEGARARK